MLTANKKHIFTADELDTILETEESLIIYGAGGYGKRIADYIISVGKQSKVACFWVTDKKKDNDYRGIKILESREGNLMQCENSLIVIAVSVWYLFDIADIVEQYGRRYCCMTKALYLEIGRNLNINRDKIVPYKKLDFLLVGFPRCGTTSLYRAIKQIDDIYLPDEKDICFFYWCDKIENFKEWLVESYFDSIQEGQTVGMFEAGLPMNAKQVQDFFGNQTKILFSVRNPVDALFSNFKMYSRGGGVSELMSAYQKCGGYIKEEVFEECFNQNKGQQLVEMMKYINWIKQFLNYYPKEQVKVVIFEEMIKNSQEIMNEILQFVGSTCKYMYGEMPWVNEGDAVMADIEGLKIAERCANVSEVYLFYPRGVPGRSCEELFSEYKELRKQYAQTKEVHNLKLSEGMRKKLEKYYYDSVRELEELLNKDLTKIWF